MVESLSGIKMKYCKEKHVKIVKTILLLALLSCVCFAQEPAKQSKNEVPAPKAVLYSDWPQWLGPDRNGSSPEKGLLREWPEDGPKMLWMQPTTKGWGSVCISKDEIFLDGLGSKYTLHCLDAFNGREKWKFEYELGRKKLDVGWGWCPRDTVAATEKYVYIQNEQGQLYCIDRKKGVKVWMRDLDVEFGTSHNDWKGWCQSPLVMDGIVFMAAAGETYKPSDKARYFGFDAETGKTVWELKEPPGPSPHRFGGADPSQTAAVVTFGNDKCALVTANGKLFAIRFKDGKKIWTHEKAHIQQHMSGPIIVDDRILLSPFTEDMKLIKVNWSDPSDPGTRLWKYDGATDCSSPVVYNGYIYTFNEEKDKLMGPYMLRCIELATGKLMWEEKGFEIAESIMQADGLLFIRAGKNNGKNKVTQETILLVEATPEKYICKGKFEQEQGNYMGWVMPTLAYGRLFIRSERILRCYQAAKTLPSKEEIQKQLGR